MINLNLRTFSLIKISIIYLILCLNSSLADENLKKNMIFIGSHDAKVKIKIFSSLTCPHCANFHMNVISEIRKKYIENGQVQLIFLDFPLDQAAFNASKLLHCLDQKKQMLFLDTLYESQTKWTNGSTIDDINENLKKIVKNLGISSTQFDRCLLDEVISDKILNGRIDASQKYSIDSTPAIVINEKKLEGSVSFKSIKKKIEKLI